MNLIFSDQAWEDYQYWQETDKKMVRRIHELLKDIRRDPRSGIGLIIDQRGGGPPVRQTQQHEDPCE